MKNRNSWFLVIAAILFAFVGVLSAQTASTTPMETGNFLTNLVGGLFSEGKMWTTLITVCSVVFGIWQNKNADTKHKVAQSLVKVIEAATQLPEVKALATNGIVKIKEMANAEATALGVQDDLHKIVTNLTPQS